MSAIIDIMPHKTIKLGFILLEQFTMIAYANAIEPFRMANQLARAPLYEWRVSGSQGEVVACSNGVSLNAPTPLEDLFKCDIVIVCGGHAVEKSTTPALKNLLRQLDKEGIGLGSLCNGGSVLAAAGVLDGVHATIHWESLAVAQTQYPKVLFEETIFIIDKNRYTCAGGTASLDMALQMIRQQYGRRLAMEISEQFIMDRIRSNEARQSLPIQVGIGPGYEYVAEAIDLMQSNLEELLSLNEIAVLVGISLRQLERLFRKYCGVSPAQYYLRLRLRRAKELLSQTSMPIMQVTVACGFTTSSHFCKVFRNEYGYSPREERKKLMLLGN